MYKTLQYYLRTFKTMNKKYHIYGPSWGLMIWAFEVMTGFGDAFAVKCSTTDVPRCLRWNFLNNFTDVSDDDVYAHFDDEEEEISMIHPDGTEIAEGYFRLVHQLKALTVKFHVPTSAYIIVECPLDRQLFLSLSMPSKMFTGYLNVD